MPTEMESRGPYRGTGLPGATAGELPEPPPWRSFRGGPDLPAPPADDPYARVLLGEGREPLPAEPDMVARVNAALRLRRPLLVTGEPGTGKSSLAYRISRELGLGRVLRWQITSLSTLREGLFEEAYGSSRHDAQDAQDTHGADARLGPLGTAFLPHGRPRVLLVDRLDRAEIALPEDLCTVLAAGGFAVPGGVARLATADDAQAVVPVPGGAVRCHAFPVVVITSAEERELPLDLVRRCVALRLPRPGPDLLRAMAANRFPADPGDSAGPTGGCPAPDVVQAFLDRAVRTDGPVVERFLDSLHLAVGGVLQGLAADGSWQEAADTVWEWTAAEET